MKQLLLVVIFGVSIAKASDGDSCQRRPGQYSLQISEVPNPDLCKAFIAYLKCEIARPNLTIERQAGLAGNLRCASMAYEQSLQLELARADLQADVRTELQKDLQEVQNFLNPAPAAEQEKSSKS